MMLLRLGSGTRNALAFAHDLVVSAGAWWLAYWFRFNLDVPAEFVRGFAHTLPWVVGIYAVLFWKMGLYRGLWRYASLPDLRRIIIAVSVGALAVPAVFTLAGFAWPAPRSAYLISPLLMILAMGGSRLAYRAWKEQGLGSVISVTEAAPVVVLGAGRAAATLLKELATSRQWRVVALLDDDTGKRGGEIIGVKVHGPLQQVAEIAERFSARQAIIAMP